MQRVFHLYRCRRTTFQWDRFYQYRFKVFQSVDQEVVLRGI